MLKSALRARVRARFGLGARARDGELILGFGGQGEGRTGARGVEERNSGDGELKRAELRERGGEKWLETLLTTTRSSGVAWPTRIGDGTADRRRDAELREAPTMARRRLGFERGKRRRLGEAKGVVRALFIGPVGDPWRAGQGAARGGVWRPDSLSPRRPRGGRRPRQAGPACRRQKGGGADLGRERKVGRWKGGVWAAGEEKKKGRGRWAGPAGLKTRGGKRKDFAFLKLKQTIQFKLKFREFKFEPNNKQ